MSLGIIDFVKKAWTLTMTVIDDDTNRWENQMAALTEFLKRYSWTPNTTIKKGAVIYCPFGLNERLIAQNNGITGATEPTWASYKEQGQITDGTVVWKIEAPYFKQEVNVAIGTIIQQPWTSAPPGFVAIHNGPILERETYPKLWEFVSKYCSVVSETEWQRRATLYESVGVFSLGDGSTTFRCPKMLSFARGCAPENSGTYYADQNKEHNHNGGTMTIPYPEHYHAFGYHNSNNNGRFLSTGDRTQNYPIIPGGTAAMWNGSGGGGNSGRPTDNLNLVTSKDVEVASSSKNVKVTIEKSGSEQAYPRHVIWPYYLRTDDL